MRLNCQGQIEISREKGKLSLKGRKPKDIFLTSKTVYFINEHSFRFHPQVILHAGYKTLKVLARK